MAKVLVVDDDADFLGAVSRILATEHEVSRADSMGAAERLLGQGSFDLVLLDLFLQDGDGHKLIARMRTGTGNAETPVIFLSGRGTVEDKLVAFSLGAADFVMKPVDSRELLARIAARIQARDEARRKDHLVSIGDLSFDLSLQKVFVSQNGAKAELDLTPMEYRLLLYFTRHGGILSRDQLLAAAWPGRVHVLDRTVDAHVSNLRKKLATTSWAIRSRHGVGYVFGRRNRLRAAA